jgi:hypothetical protein
MDARRGDDKVGFGVQKSAPASHRGVAKKERISSRLTDGRSGGEGRTRA